MQIIQKTFVLDYTKKIRADFIENYIKNAGFMPLRWAIVEIKENKFIIEAIIC